MKIKDPKRFLKEVKEKDEPKAPARKGPAPKEKAPKEKPELKVSKEEAERLLENVRKAARVYKIAQEAFDLGLEIKENTVARLRQEAEDAKNAAEEAGVSLRSAGRANGMMSGKEASFRLLQEEGRPMRARELCELAHERGYCDMPGKTPWATIASTLTTDINEKGEKSRFKKDGPGLFTINEKYKEN